MKSIFDKAMNAYDKTINDLKALTNGFKEYADSRGIKYNPTITLKQFDVLLQYSMLQVALEDKYLHKSEVNFIIDIVKYGDFCEYLSNKCKTNITWKMIYQANERDLINILNDLEQNVKDISKDFISIFSIFDAFTDHDYLEDLKNNIFTIIYAVCQADGNADERIENGCLILNVIAEIEITKNQIEEKKTTNTPAKKSLKDFYVKKN